MAVYGCGTVNSLDVGSMRYGGGGCAVVVVPRLQCVWLSCRACNAHTIDTFVYISDARPYPPVPPPRA